MTLRSLPRRRAVLMLTLAAATATLPASPALAGFWGSSDIEGNGRIKTATRAPGSFHGIAMSLPGSVEVRLGDAESVTLETDENLLPLIETVVENGVLQIRADPRKIGRNSGLTSRHMKLVVQARSIDQLALGGSGSINASKLAAPKFSIDLGGSGAIGIGSIDTGELSIDLGGSGEIKVADGRASRLSVSIAGFGNADLGRLQSQSASASIAGSGDATFAVRDALDVSVVGSGNVNYYGDPKVSRSVMGSGAANRMGARR